MFRSVATLIAFVSLAVIGSLAFAAGCSSKSSGSTAQSSEDLVDCTDASCPACTGPAASSGGVSFSKDVQPILQTACGTGGAMCHGAQSGSQQNLYLAEPTSSGDGYGDPTTILKGIVNVMSLESSENIVTESDPGSSFLMHKIDGDLCTIMSTCVPITAALPTSIAQPCGVQMPAAGPGIPGPALSAAERTTIWNWIAQGAMNN